MLDLKGKAEPVTARRITVASWPLLHPRRGRGGPSRGGSRAKDLIKGSQRVGYDGDRATPLKVARSIVAPH